MSPIPTKSAIARRTVCDHCRRRRIRCDGELPCNQCNGASLTCKREHVPKRRGPKRGSGRVINELRAQEGDAGQLYPNLPTSNGSAASSQSSKPPSIDQWISDSAAASSSPTTGQQRWHPIMSDTQHNEEPTSIFTSDQFRPTSPCYFHLIPTCLDLFREHIYPIMPLVYFPTLRASLSRPLEMPEKNLLYSLCALTSTHMSGKSILALGPPSWEAAGRFFLDECISVRQQYDFVEDKSLSAVISSYFVSTAFFELNQNRKSWYYLREALTNLQDLGCHDEKTYVGLPPSEALCRRRTFWILYVTERSFAILRHKPLTLQKTPAFPSTLHPYEAPEIHTGFMHLVNSYHLLDSSFVDSWNESTSAPASTLTYTTLQQQLSLPSHAIEGSLSSIQKADILITQQWLRLIIWQSSMRQGLLSSNAEEESMTFAYPLKIAHSLLSVISSLPTTAIEVHGMGIFEKIFEIGNTMLDVLHAYGGGPGFGGSGLGGSGLGGALEGIGEGAARGITQDPFSIFIKTLSQTPNSQRQYATLLLQKAAEKPLPLTNPSPLNILSHNPTPNTTPALFVPPSTASPDFEFSSSGGGAGTGAGAGFLEAGAGNGAGIEAVGRRWRGSIVGEIEEDGTYTVHDQENNSRGSWGIENEEGLLGTPTANMGTGWINTSEEGSLLVNDDGMEGWLKME